MKPSLPLIFCAATLLAGCSTLSNRHGDYRPTEGSGPYSKALKAGTWRKGVELKPNQKAQPGKLTPPPPAPVLPYAPVEPLKLP